MKDEIKHSARFSNCLFVTCVCICIETRKKGRTMECCCYYFSRGWMALTLVVGALSACDDSNAFIIQEHACISLMANKKEAKKETNDSPYESLVLATSTYLKLTTTSTKYIMSSHPCDERRLSFSQKGSSENKASIQCPRFNVD